MPLSISSGETLLFIGDSITDCGRRDPQTAPLGRGYVRIFNDLRLTREPVNRFEVVNRGIGGNTLLELRNLHDAFQGLLDDHHPDILCPEPVHPNQTGHTFMAEQVYAALSD